MVRSLIIILLALYTTNLFAQKAGSSLPKTTEKHDETQIDYKQLGAPMPPIRLIIYKDTSTARKDSVAATTSAGKKKKKGPVPNMLQAPEKVVTNEDVNNGANLFIMLFNPTCGHCEDETAMLQKNIGLFKKSKFLMMVNPVMMPYLSDFVNRLHLADYPLFTVGADSAGYVNNVFLYQALPQINIYNAERKLLKVYAGEVSIDTLKQYIQ
jgi:hypothetical protein